MSSTKQDRVSQGKKNGVKENVGKRHTNIK